MLDNDLHFLGMLVGCSFTQFITDLIAALSSTNSPLALSVIATVPEFAVSSDSAWPSCLEAEA